MGELRVEREKREREREREGEREAMMASEFLRHFL
jgi:hypothetical protein